MTLSSNGPVERLGMPMMAVGPNGQEFEVVDLPESALGGMEGGQQPRAMAMERKGPEFLSSNPQMQILTCFGHCGADCQAYCEDNYLACTHNDPASRSYHDGPTYLEPAPDYYAPTGRGHGVLILLCWGICVLDAGVSCLTRCPAAAAGVGFLF